MENTLPQVGAIRMAGSVIGPFRPDLKLPMIATRDIGTAAADALLSLGFHGKQTRELLGQRDLDYTEVATIIGKAIGKPSSRVHSRARRSGSIRDGSDGNVRKVRRITSRNDCLAKRRIYAGARTSHVP